MDGKDYVNYADGLLYCGKCRSPKQCRVTAFGRQTVQYCTCKCEQERLAAEKVRFNERKKEQDNAAKRRSANIKTVDLLIELDGDGHGRITGAISSSGGK